MKSCLFAGTTMTVLVGSDETEGRFAVVHVIKLARPTPLLNAPPAQEMQHEHDQRHHEHDVDEAAGDMESKAAAPNDEKNNCNGQEHAQRSRSAQVLDALSNTNLHENFC